MTRVKHQIWLAAVAMAATMMIVAARAEAQCTPFSLYDTITAPTPGTRFGAAVAISTSYLLVGSDGEIAYLFDSTTGGNLQTFTNPAPAFADWFGTAVAVSENYAVVGAWGDAVGGFGEAGSVHIFDPTTGTLLRSINNPSPSAFERFGISVALSGDSLLIGAQINGVHLYNAATGSLIRIFTNPNQTGVSGTDDFGVSVGLSGTNALIAAPDEDVGGTDTGSAYLFSTTNGALLRTFNNPTPTAGDEFGSSVAISGNNIVIGEPFEDTGAIDAGIAHVYSATTGALLHTLNHPAPAIGDEFGSSVSIDGNSVVVGAPTTDIPVFWSGAVSLFSAATGQHLQTISNPSSPSSDQFGNSVAILGLKMLVGAHLDDIGGSDSGTAYVFSCTPPNAVRRNEDYE